MSRPSRGALLGLCTAAVGAIYAAGYLYTEPAAHANVPAPSARAEAPAGNPTTSHHPSGPSARRSNSGPSGGSKSPSARYRDGVYTGSGANPYGTLTVSVRIAQGKIAEVKITSYYMHYPQSFIDPVLPDEVLSQQTWRIYIVTGATASSYNFAEAVYRALQKAKA